MLILREKRGKINKDRIKKYTNAKKCEIVREKNREEKNMASNPMQRKARNSFLLGVIITLLIAGVIIALLFMQLKQKSDQLQAEANAKRNVYVLNQDVKSGQVITEDMFSTLQVNQDAIPSNATATSSVISTWYLQTKDGKTFNTDYYNNINNTSFSQSQQGLYINEPDSIIEVVEIDGKRYKCSDKYTGDKSNLTEVPSREDVNQDDDGAYIVDASNSSDKITRVYQEATTGEYYVYKLDSTSLSTGSSKTRVKEYLTLQNVPVVAKVTMNKNTVVTPNLVVQSDEVVTDDVRKQEYNMIVLPVDLMTNDYIDIRLMTPSGQDFIVVSKAKVDVPLNSDGSYIYDTIRVNLREDEILSMSSAIVEAYGLLGSKLYATKYVEAGMQESAMPTYTPNASVTAQIQSNPNIVNIASEELATRYSDTAKKNRNDYLQSLINSSEDYSSNVQDKSDENITNQNTARQKYLESLGGTTTTN